MTSGRGKGFTWERGPFSKCALCGEESFGILRAGGQSLVKRCWNCRYSTDEELPSLDKKVIYLDQFVFSLLFNVEAGGRLPKGHEAFAKELHKRLRRLVLLQQVILPHSDIHRDETTVFHSAMELRQAYEFMGGDVELLETHKVEFDQTLLAAQAYLAGMPLQLDYSVDQVLKDRRNGWLPDMHISVRSDFTIFADGLRRKRDESHIALRDLADKWARDRPSFADVLKTELGSILSGKIQALASSERNKWHDDPMVSLNAIRAPIQNEARELLRLMQKSGIPQDEAGQKVRDFWASDANVNLPHHQISSYLFAGVARRVILGQKTIINKGLMNDIRAISCYAPYVDAMFVDKGCEQLLSERPISDDLRYKARIFSLSGTEAFLSYLDELEAVTPSVVREHASQIYGIA